MAVRIPHAHGRLSQGEIERVESLLRLRLPADYRQFVTKHDGAKPERNTFVVGHNNSAGVLRFIPLREIAVQREQLGNELNPGSIPIAWAEGGNFVCLDIDVGGSVSFWDHEIPNQRFEVASTFDEFLSALVPFDVSDVQVAPEDILDAWVDPELLRQWRKQ